MKAMLLAAGFGTRLRPLTDDRPKCLIEVAGMPVLERNVRWLVRHGIRDLVVNLHHHPAAITALLGDGTRFGARVAYSSEPTLLGTAGALSHAARSLEDGPFLVVYADNIFDVELRVLLERHAAVRPAITMAVLWREEVRASGLARLSSDDSVVDFEEKPRRFVGEGGWVSAGLLACMPQVLTALPEGPADIGRDLVPALLRRGDMVKAYRVTVPESVMWIDTPADLAATRKRAASQ